VVIEPGSMLASIAHRQMWEVNSRHHQAVARLAGGFKVCASDPEDGTVEAIELPARRYVLAVQWHPENQVSNDPEQRTLFQTFAAAL
jgi:gamma-glutamyl-gamma-aminobutyrate hydrolase PuuD